MLHLAARMARHRAAALLAVACAVLGAAAFLTAIGVLAESGLRSHVAPQRLAGADVVVTASQSLPQPGDLAVALPERAPVPASLVAELAGLPGVVAAVGDVSFPAAVIGADGEVVDAGDAASAGHGWSSTALLDGAALFGSAAPSDGEEPPDSAATSAGPAIGQVALGSGLAATAKAHVGDRVQVIAAGTPGTYEVAAVVPGGMGGVYFDDVTALRLAGGSGGQAAAPTATVDLVALRVEPGAVDEVADTVRDLVQDAGLIVSTGDARGDVESPQATAGRGLLPAIAGSMSGVTLLVVGFIVAGALAVSISAQRRDLALLRAVGATPRQVRSLAAWQATVVSVAAMIPGVALGYLLAERLRHVLASSGMLSPDLPLTFGPLPGVAAAVLLVLVVQPAARAAARRVSRLPATEAVAESRTEPRTPSRVRALTGGALIVGSLGIAVTPLLARTPEAAIGASLAGIVAAIGLALVGPLLVGGVGRWLARRLPARASASTWLAVAHTHGHSLRVGAAVSTLALVVVFTLTYAFTQTTVLAAAAGDLRAATTAQATLSAPALGGVSDEVAAAVRDLPGVEAVAPLSTTTVVAPLTMFGETTMESAPAAILTPDSAGVLDLDLRDGDLADLRGDTVAVDAGSARAHPVGSTLDLVLGDGTPVRAEVVAVHGRGLAFGSIILAGDLAAGHSAHLAQSVLVRTDGTAAASEALAGFTAEHPGVVLLDGSAGASAGAGASAEAGGADGLGAVPPELWINLVVLAVLLGYLLLGVVNTLVAGTLERRHEIAALRLAGATPRQVRSMMRREAALASGVALAAGGLLSVVPLAMLGIGFLDRPLPAGPWWLAPGVAALVVVLAFAAVELPTRRTLRTPPARMLAEAL
ncbi:FtsX-like permease family protein [Cellulomonas timonensis]|uniref:FtsX-like permease family protein n=1 Tax=Cellulomonas timonensis TaxID=1689271 RepID=UPI0008295016|nr:FtsX-like permease family protein [Cellulomonas timonensis]